MRIFWYIVIFITPTILVLVYRSDIQDFLTEKGLLGPKQTASSKPPVEQVKEPATPSNAEPSPSPPSPSTGRTSAPSPTPQVTQTEDDAAAVAAKRHPLPEFKSLEAVVGYWRKVPENAYPEVVSLKKPVDLELVVDGKVIGKSQLRVGQKAYPVSLNGKRLAISGSPGGQGPKGEIALDDTDFKEQVRAKYESWKSRRIADVHKRRKEEERRIASKGDAPEAPASARSKLGDEPQPNADGSVKCMVDSIKAGQVKEIDLDHVQYWRWVGYEEFRGKAYWVGIVGYTAKTIFGDINAEGKALIRNGKVEKWIYSGSEEEIQ